MIGARAGLSWHATAIALASLLATAAALRSAHSAPQTFDTALPVAQDQFVFRGQLSYRRATDDRTPADRELEVRGAIAVLGYGATRGLALFAVVPWLDKGLELDAPAGARSARTTAGVGDARLFARHTLLRRDRSGSTLRLAPFAGIELPSGDDDEEDRFGRLPRPLQIGSGSWDPFGGLILSWQTLAWELDAQVSYQANTDAGGFERGDELRIDGSLQYRLWPRELGGGVPGFLYGVIEANLLHQDENRMGGVEDPDSGGTTLFLSPGVQYVTRRWVVEGIVQVPVAQDPGGGALEDDFIVRAGFRVSF